MSDRPNFSLSGSRLPTEPMAPTKVVDEGSFLRRWPNGSFCINGFLSREPLSNLLPGCLAGAGLCQHHLPAGAGHSLLDLMKHGQPTSQQDRGSGRKSDRIDRTGVGVEPTRNCLRVKSLSA